MRKGKQFLPEYPPVMCDDTTDIDSTLSNNQQETVMMEDTINVQTK